MGQVATWVPADASSRSDYFSAVVLSGVGRIEVALRGELDVAAVPVLLAAVAPLLSRDGCSVELDARDLSFLDASGIGCIVSLRYVLRARGGELAMRSVSPLGRRLLAVCGLSDLLADAELPGAAATVESPVRVAAT